MHFSFSRIDYSCFFVFFCLYNWNFVLSTLFSIHPENCTIVIMIILIRLKNFTFLFIVKSTEILVIIVTFNPHATKHFQMTSSKGGASRILILLYTFIFCIQISTIVIFQVIDFIHPMQPSNMNIIYKKFWRFWDFHVLGPFNAKIVWLFGYRMFKWQKHIYYLVLCSYVKQSMWVIYKYMCNIFCQMLWNR